MNQFLRAATLSLYMCLSMSLGAFEPAMAPSQSPEELLNRVAKELATEYQKNKELEAGHPVLKDLAISTANGLASLWLWCKARQFDGTREESVVVDGLAVHMSYGPSARQVACYCGAAFAAGASISGLVKAISDATTSVDAVYLRTKKQVAQALCLILVDVKNVDQSKLSAEGRELWDLIQKSREAK